MTGFRDPEFLANPVPRVVVIGPVLPFRGGIAQHTTLLSRALKEHCHHSVVSFRRLYPRILFPGESDRDPDYEGHREEGATYSLDSLNPMSWLRSARAVKGLSPDFVVIPWWTFFLAPVFLYLARSFRREGIPVVFMCHNVEDHEASWWKQRLSKVVLSNGDAYIVHSGPDCDKLNASFQESHAFVHPMPIFDQFPPPQLAPEPRGELELLFFGFVRPYKGLDILIDAMAAIQRDGVFLTIAGEFWNGLTELREKISELGLEKSIELRPRFHSDQEIAQLFNRADAVVLPYLSATGSAVIPVAYHYNKPVIASNVGGLPEVVVEGRSGWLVPPGDANALANILEGLSRSACKSMSEFVVDYKTKFSWDGLARCVLEAGASASGAKQRRV